MDLLNTNQEGETLKMMLCVFLFSGLTIYEEIIFISEQEET